MCSLVTHRENLIKPSPWEPNMVPGATKIWCFWSKWSIKASEVSPFDNFAQTNIPAFEATTSQFNRSTNFNSSCLRSAYTLFKDVNQEWLVRNACTTPICNGRNIPLSICVFTFITWFIYSLDPDNIPTRHPAILKLLLKEFNSNATSFAPWTDNILKGSLFKIWLYGLSFTTKINDQGIGRFTIQNSGADYQASNTVAAVALSGGSGTGATANITTNSDGKVSTIVLVDKGTGYKLGDILSVPDVALSKSGSAPADSQDVQIGIEHIGFGAGVVNYIKNRTAISQQTAPVETQPKTEQKPSRKVSKKTQNK